MFQFGEDLFDGVEVGGARISSILIASWPLWPLVCVSLKVKNLFPLFVRQAIGSAIYETAVMTVFIALR